MPDVAYAKMKGKAGHNRRTIYKGKRRAKVAELVAEGMSERKIAAELGVGKTTVARDKAWLKTSAHLLRAQETALVLAENDDMPTNLAEFREQEVQNVIDLLATKMTYEQVARKLGVSISTVVRHVNTYLSEYGDFGGRTMMEWRNEHLLTSYGLMAELEEDMNCQPEKGSGKGWDLTPFQAQRTRDAARKRYLERRSLMVFQAAHARPAPQP